MVPLRDNKLREEYLRELIASYLFKDILALEGIRYSEKLVRLLQLLAFQIGNEVSLAEIGRQLAMSKNTGSINAGHPGSISGEHMTERKSI